MCEPNSLNMAMALFFAVLCGISIGTIFTCWLVTKMEESRNGKSFTP